MSWRGAISLCLLAAVVASHPGVFGAQTPNPAKMPKIINSAEDPAEQQLEELRSHGIGTEAPELISFLETGLPAKANLPKEPAEKSQLLVNAMVRLADQKSGAAVPILEKIALRKFPKGVESVMRLDLERTSPESQQDFQESAIKLLQYNAMNALGIIGDRRALRTAQTVYASERSDATKIQFAICLASLGDASGVDLLVSCVQRGNRRESAAAARAFYIITGQDFGYTENTPIRLRRARAAQYAQWWQTNRANFRAEPGAVLRRRLSPSKMASYEPRSTRDLLRVASNYFDFNNAMKSREARDAISRSGVRLNPELEQIALDVKEEINIRMEAMNWYYDFNRSSSKTLLKKLRRDENPEVADKANTLLQQIEEDATGTGSRLNKQFGK